MINSQRYKRMLLWLDHWHEQTG